MTLASLAPLAALPPRASIPSPTTAVWHLGPVPIRAYALCIVLGIVVASVVTEARLRRRGAPRGTVLDIAVWAVPFGIIGARIYHVITSWQGYFGPDGHPIRAFYIWQGGLGIWGAVAGGAVGAWLGARQLGLPLSMVADALAPGLPLAQAVGRFGNWFNNELYGGPTDLPWGLNIYQMADGQAVRDPAGNPELVQGGPFHPTFAYEALWDAGVGVLVLLVDRKLKLGRGRAFALYVMAYTVGRCWVEMMRIDEANHILGLRLNVWTSILVFLGALIYFLRVRGPRAYVVPVGSPDGVEPAGEASSGGDVSQVDVSRGRTQRNSAEMPVAHRVVTEEQFRAYQETGVVPTDDAPLAASDADSAGSAASGADGAGSAESGSDSAAARSAGDR